MKGTSYRPGARFGPMGIREASRRIDGYNVPQGVDPFRDWARIVDCGDVALTYVVIWTSRRAATLCTRLKI